MRGRLVAERLQAAEVQPVVIDGTSHEITASIGLALADVGDITWEEVLRNADVAMYLAKDRGTAGIAVYEPALHEESLQRVQCRPTCSVRCAVTNWCCTSSRPSSCSGDASSGSRHWCAGDVLATGWSVRSSSSPKRSGAD